MFCYLDLHKRDVYDPTTIREVIEPKLIPDYAKMTPFRRALALLIYRAADLRLFLHMHGAKDAAMAVNVYMRSVQVKGKVSAIAAFYRYPSYPSVLPEVLQRALQMDTGDEDWTVSSKRKGKNTHLTAYHKGDHIHDFTVKNDNLNWSKYRWIREQILDNQL